MSSDEVSKTIDSLYENRGRVTSSRPNDEKPKVYQEASSASKEFYKTLSARTNKILDANAWE